MESEQNALDSLHLRFADPRAKLLVQFADLAAQLRELCVVLRPERFSLRCGARSLGLLLGSEGLDGFAKVAHEIGDVVRSHRRRGKRRRGRR